VPKGNGLQVGNFGSSGYSTVVKIRLDQTNNYRRILDTTNGSDDDGLYSLDGFAYLLAFPESGSSANAVFFAGEYAEVAVVSSIAVGGSPAYTKVYVNGVLETTLPVDQTPTGTLRFVKDNTSGGTTEEESGGAIACIRVFNTALSDAEVAQIHAAGGCTNAGAPPPDTTAPNTNFKGKPPKRGTDQTPTFRFKSNEVGSTFLCKVDGKRFRRCTSPFTTRRLGPGGHTFKVKAVDATGNADATPAKYSFRILG
jgi:hypothetical protein